MKALMTNHESPTSTFPLSSKQKVGMLGCSVFLILLDIAISFLASIGQQDPDYFPAMVLIMGVFIAPFALLLTVYAFRSRVVISPSGIEVHTVERVVKTSWENVDRIGEMCPTPMTKPRQGLILREPAVRFSWWVIGFSRRNLIQNGQDRFIDLQTFGINWRDNGLGREIRRYAPHLFESALGNSDNSPATEEVALPTEPIVKRIDKIGGWLIPVGIWLVVNLISSVFVIMSASVARFSLIGKSPVPTIVHSAIVFEIFTNGLLALASIILLVLFFDRKHLFIKAALAFLGLRLLFGIADFAFMNFAKQSVGAEPTPMYALNGISFSSSLLLLYLMNSKRVRETFVNQ